MTTFKSRYLHEELGIDRGAVIADKGSTTLIVLMGKQKALILHELSQRRSWNRDKTELAHKSVWDWSFLHSCGQSSKGERDQSG